MWKQAAVFTLAVAGLTGLSGALGDVPDASAAAKAPLQVYRLDTYFNGINGKTTAHLGFVNESAQTIDKLTLKLAARHCVQTALRQDCNYFLSQDVALNGPFAPRHDADLWLSEPVVGPCTRLVGLSVQFGDGKVSTVAGPQLAGYLTTQAESGSCPLAPIKSGAAGQASFQAMPPYGSNDGKGP